MANEKKKREQPPLKIGELLVKEGYIRQSDIEKALQIQQEESAIANQPLGKILVQQNVISNEDLKSLLEHPCQRKQLGTLAQESGLISKEQLKKVLNNLSDEEKIGETMVQEGLISEQQVKALLYKQVGSQRIGDLALKFNMISEDDLEAALFIKRSKRTIGAILCGLNLVTPHDLNHVLQKYRKQMKFGEILVRQNYISQDQLDAALLEQAKNGGQLGEILVNKRLITLDELYNALSKQVNIPYEKIESFSYEEGDIAPLISIVGQRYAETNMILPLRQEGNLLTLAICDPEKAKALQELKAVYSHLNMRCVLITQENFEKLFETLYGESLEASMASNQASTRPESLDGLQINLSEELDDKDGTAGAYAMSSMEVEQVVNYIIKYGIVNDASDIHIEQDRSGPKLRFRIDGVLTRLKEKWFDEKLHEMIGAIVSRIKVISNIDIAERRIPQDGVFRVSFFDKGKRRNVDLDFRVATCPAIIGENVTIRILDSRKAKVGLENLNHSRHVLEPFMRLLKSSAGMVLVTGPTGSGKSSSLYGALQYIYNPGIKIITAEDPIEYSFPGIMQTQAHQKIKLTFAKLLRSFLRLDPDVILVGEMRDEETATIGFDAAQTGHLLLSTLHTNDAVAAISRLRDMNIEYSQMATSLLCILSQRLCRQICYNCMVSYEPEPDEWRTLFPAYPDHMTFYKGNGCDVCNFTGYKGRVLISEIFEITRDISRALSRGASEREIKQLALENGMKTMVEDGLQKMHQTTLSEVIRVLPHEMMKAYRSRQMGDATQSSNQAIISNPMTQAEIIERLYSQFETLQKVVGNTSNGANSMRFQTFIKENYKRVCDQYGCSSVCFSIKQIDDQVTIFAQPDKGT
ncbi:MAG: Flp pilus assembly complex ATPase component TadA [Deltaproteobacteria bacterium]|nr:Flp pilus assembly complex ATPase component TadA [Deltaproteobacteria bacterium]